MIVLLQLAGLSFKQRNLLASLIAPIRESAIARTYQSFMAALFDMSIPAHGEALPSGVSQSFVARNRPARTRASTCIYYIPDEGEGKK